jgi:malate dehydrogenase
MKVSVIGAGNVGASVAEYIAFREIAHNVVILDIKEGYAEGKAMDLNQCATLSGFSTNVTGSTNDYSKTKGSDVVVITSGMPRKPGMTREELIGTNANIVKSVVEQSLDQSPDAILVIISNPMDTMTYLTNKISGLDKHKIIGMGGALDSARFKYRLAEAMNCNPMDVHGSVIGGHGDTTMIPLTRLANRHSMPVSNFLNDEQMENVRQETMVGGATLTKLLGTSAWHAPGAAGAHVVDTIIRNKKKVVPSSVLLEGEYGLDGICLGVPVVIGNNGWEEIIDLHLNKDEMEQFHKSAEAVRGMNAIVDEMLAK